MEFQVQGEKAKAEEKAEEVGHITKAESFAVACGVGELKPNETATTFQYMGLVDMNPHPKVPNLKVCELWTAKDAVFVSFFFF